MNYGILKIIVITIGIIYFSEDFLLLMGEPNNSYAADQQTAAIPFSNPSIQSAQGWGPPMQESPTEWSGLDANGGGDSTKERRNGPPLEAGRTSETDDAQAPSVSLPPAHLISRQRERIYMLLETQREQQRAFEALEKKYSDLQEHAEDMAQRAAAAEKVRADRDMRNLQTEVERQRATAADLEHTIRRYQLEMAERDHTVEGRERLFEGRLQELQNQLQLERRFALEAAEKAFKAQLEQREQQWRKHAEGLQEQLKITSEEVEDARREQKALINDRTTLRRQVEQLERNLLSSEQHFKHEVLPQTVRDAEKRMLEVVQKQEKTMLQREEDMELERRQWELNRAQLLQQAERDRAAIAQADFKASGMESSLREKEQMISELRAQAAGFRKALQRRDEMALTDEALLFHDQDRRLERMDAENRDLKKQLADHEASLQDKVRSLQLLQRQREGEHAIEMEEATRRLHRVERALEQTRLEQQDTGELMESKEKALQNLTVELHRERRDKEILREKMYQLEDALRRATDECEGLQRENDVLKQQLKHMKHRNEVKEKEISDYRTALWALQSRVWQGGRPSDAGGRGGKDIEPHMTDAHIPIVLGETLSATGAGAHVDAAGVGDRGLKMTPPMRDFPPRSARRLRESASNLERVEEPSGLVRPYHERQARGSIEDLSHGNSTTASLKGTQEQAEDAEEEGSSGQSESPSCSSRNEDLRSGLTSSRPPSEKGGRINASKKIKVGNRPTHCIQFAASHSLGGSALHDTAESHLYNVVTVNRGIPSEAVAANPVKLREGKDSATPDARKDSISPGATLNVLSSTEGDGDDALGEGCFDSPTKCFTIRAGSGAKGSCLTTRPSSSGRVVQRPLSIDRRSQSNEMDLGYDPVGAFLLRNKAPAELIQGARGDGSNSGGGPHHPFWGTPQKSDGLDAAPASRSPVGRRTGEQEAQTLGTNNNNNNVSLSTATPTPGSSADDSALVGLSKRSDACHATPFASNNNNRNRNHHNCIIPNSETRPGNGTNSHLHSSTPSSPFQNQAFFHEMNGGRGKEYFQDSSSSTTTIISGVIAGDGPVTSPTTAITPPPSRALQSLSNSLDQAMERYVSSPPSRTAGGGLGVGASEPHMTLAELIKQRAAGAPLPSANSAVHEGEEWVIHRAANLPPPSPPSQLRRRLSEKHGGAGTMGRHVYPQPDSSMTRRRGTEGSAMRSETEAPPLEQLRTDNIGVTLRSTEDTECDQKNGACASVSHSLQDAAPHGGSGEWHRSHDSALHASRMHQNEDDSQQSETRVAVSIQSEDMCDMAGRSTHGSRKSSKRHSRGSGSSSSSSRSRHAEHSIRLDALQDSFSLPFSE